MAYWMRLRSVDAVPVHDDGDDDDDDLNNVTFKNPTF